MLFHYSFNALNDSDGLGFHIFQAVKDNSRKARKKCHIANVLLITRKMWIVQNCPHASIFTPSNKSAFCFIPKTPFSVIALYQRYNLTQVLFRETLFTAPPLQKVFRQTFFVEMGENRIESFQRTLCIPNLCHFSSPSQDL